MNKTIITGNIGRIDEIRPVGETQVVNFNVAVTERWSKNGERQEKTTWFRCAAWGRLADVVTQYGYVGMKVGIEGTVDVNAYINKDGEPAASLELRVKEFEMLSSKGERGENGSHMSNEYQSPPASGNGSLGDIPF